MLPASIAMSVPVPIAMPRSACASAGASLMPSPTKATRLPSLLQTPHLLGLVLGQDLGAARARSRSAARSLRRSAVVAGDHHGLDAFGRSCLIAALPHRPSACRRPRARRQSAPSQRDPIDRFRGVFELLNLRKHGAAVGNAVLRSRSAGLPTIDVAAVRSFRVHALAGDDFRSR